jgi:myosin-1
MLTDITMNTFSLLTLFTLYTFIHFKVIFNGIPENIRIAQMGFVMRVDWADFIKRFKMLSRRTWPNVPAGVEPGIACLHICEDVGLLEGEYLGGKVSKIFIKDHATSERLETKRRESLDRMAVIISKVKKKGNDDHIKRQ